ncbi:MAG TPA: hypothetical protein VFC50_01495 [Candidatus Dormibacteraeota bacterium]|nr:hypothetical protein [Candidatus Dormibacteraeota bacterium]
MFNKFAFFGLSGVPEIAVIIVLLAIFVFEIAMLISAITNKNITGNTRALWIVGMILIHPFVAIGYYFTDYKKAS